MKISDKLNKNQIKSLNNNDLVLVINNGKEYRCLVRIQKIGLIFKTFEGKEIIYHKKDCDVYSILSLPKAVLIETEFSYENYCRELEDINLIDVFDNYLLAKEYVEKNKLAEDSYMILEKNTN